MGGNGFAAVPADAFEILRAHGASGPRMFSVWCALRYYQGRRAECWPSVAELAAFVGCSQRVVSAALTELGAAGYVTRRRRQAKNAVTIACLPGESPAGETPDTLNPSGLDRKDSAHQEPRPEESSVSRPEVFSVLDTRDSSDPSSNQSIEPIQEETRAPAAAPPPICVQHKARKKRATAEPFPDPPPELAASPEFVTLWEEWRQHLREKRKPLGPTAARRQLRKLQDLGLGRALAAMSASIEGNWQGIFEPNGNGRGRAPANPGGTDDVKARTAAKLRGASA